MYLADEITREVISKSYTWVFSRLVSYSIFANGYCSIIRNINSITKTDTAVSPTEEFTDKNKEDGNKPMEVNEDNHQNNHHVETRDDNINRWGMLGF